MKIHNVDISPFSTLLLFLRIHITFSNTCTFLYHFDHIFLPIFSTIFLECLLPKVPELSFFQFQMLLFIESLTLQREKIPSCIA